jgi:PAS domain S-box-containing protein
MLDFLKRFFSTDGFMPHGMCYEWNPGVIWLNVVSDGLITLAYYSIPLTLIYFVRKRKDLQFSWIFICFALFIVACGTTHLMEIWNIWHPVYWLTGSIKALTAAVSVMTAIQLVYLMPKGLALPSPGEMAKANKILSERTQELEASRMRLYSVLAAATENAIIACDADGTITVFNSGAERMLGYTAEEMVGKQTPAVFHLESEVLERGRELTQELGRPVQGFEVFNAKARDGQPEERIWTYVRKDGSRFPVQLTVSFAYDASGNVLGRVGIAKDYTAIKRYNDQLQEAKERAEQADRAKSEFLATMSHEIRTPMNGVIGMTGLLLDTALDAEQRNLAETIRFSGESLLHLINDILDFSKIEAGQMSLEDLDFDLRGLVEDTLEMMAVQAHAKDIELVSGVAPEVPGRLRGDPGRVRQVLTNLIGNAIKFTNEGEVAVRVTVEAEAETDVRVRFEIQDTGTGIPLETQARLFQPFVQADSSTARKFGGTGLGLAICKRIAESMRGDIGVESTLGHGSTFWVTMKFFRPAGARAEPQVAPEFIDTRVLLVVDNITRRGFLHQKISSWRMIAQSADSGEAGLAMLRQAVTEGTPYLLAIVDLQKPEMDGLAFAQKLKDDPILEATRLILLAPFGSPVPRDRLKDLRVAACCVKPVRQSILFDCLSQVLTHSGSDSHSGQPEPLIKAEEPEPRRKERVLLAEDNPVNQQVALGNLRRLGYEADLAANGFEVLEATLRKSYDIILMDCQMPALDGYQVTREIRQREGTGRHAYIVAMTANAMVGDREKCLAAGMDDYVSKPLNRAELRAAMQRGAAKPGTPRHENPLRSLGIDEDREVAQWIELFVATAPDSIADMKRAHGESRAADISLAAHSLKGSCSNFGASALAELCAQIEHAADDGNLNGMGDLIASAEKELARVIEALKTRLKSKNTP